MASAGVATSVDRSLSARRSSRLSSRSDSISSQLSEPDPHLFQENDKPNFASNIRLLGTKTSNSGDSSSSEHEDDDGDDEQDEDDESTDEEPDASAPSGVSRKRGHQTGLSLSLSNTTLGKRGRAPSDEEDGEEEEELERPMSKMSKTSANGDSITGEEDDDDYNAVDDISESEEDDDVEEMEEQMIIESEEDETSDRKRRISQSSTDSFFGLRDPEDEATHQGPHQFFDELFPDASHAVLQGEEDSGAPTTRRVRFAEHVELHSSSSTTVSEEDEEIIYPDLFLPPESLDPALRKLLEQKDLEDRSSDGESYWDFENEHDVEEVDDESGSESGSSGYETDEGETTDEEILPPQTVSRPQTSLRHGAKPPTRLRTGQAAATPVRRLSGTPLRRGPLMGSFLVDENKPIAVVDGHGKHMLFFPAPKHRRQAASGVVTASPAPSSMSAYVGQSETESDIGFSQTDPMLSSPANVMMSGLANTRNRSGSTLSTEITGPPEAFFPFTSINSNGVIETDDVGDDDDTFEEYSDEDEDLRIEDFINFGDDASSTDDEAEQLGELTDSNNTTTEDGKEPVEETPKATRTKFPGVKARQPGTPTPTNSESLLDHFDKGVVSSFRRNNDRHKNWLRSPNSLGIKGSRLHAANAPISPLRRRRGGSVSSSTGRSPLRPQDNEKPQTNWQPTQQHQFGGPLKRRIQNSNHVKRNRKNSV